MSKIIEMQKLGSESGKSKNVTKKDGAGSGGWHRLLQCLKEMEEYEKYLRLKIEKNFLHSPIGNTI